MHSGGCQCGSVRYRFDGEPKTCYTCHCTDCQTSTGAAFTLSMIVDADDIEVTAGKTAINRQDVAGSEVHRHHCADCGVALWYSSPDYPGILALKPGTFDDTGWFRPIAHLWVRSAQPWVGFDDGIPTYQEQPEMTELFGLWADRDRSRSRC